MASHQSTVDFIVAQASGAGHVSARKMFGEYGLYCRGLLVALVCDDTLFVKITNAGRALIDHGEEGAPYPGAKPCFVIGAEQIEESGWLAQLFAATAAGLPAPAKGARKSRTTPKRATVRKR